MLESDTTLEEQLAAGEPQQQQSATAGAAAYLNDVKTSTLNTVRTLVSQEKVRFVQDGFDLDLSCTPSPLSCSRACVRARVCAVC
jgi:hypothetical protein